MLGFDAQGKLSLGGLPAGNPFLVALAGTFALIGAPNGIAGGGIHIVLSLLATTYALSGKAIQNALTLTLGSSSYILTGFEMVQDYFYRAPPAIRNLVARLAQVRQTPPTLDQ